MTAMNMTSMYGFRAAAAAATALLLAGCASMSAQTVSREDAVKQRSDAFWQARARDDAQAAYAFTSPAYRKLYDVEKFKIDYAGKSMARERSVRSVTCQDDTQVCTVKVSMRARFPFLGNVDTEVFVEEYWLYDEGQWWVFKK